MLARLTYNCTPDSLADVPQEAFVDALENEFFAQPEYRESSITITFEPAHRSRVVRVAVTDNDSTDPADYDERIRGLAERAFNHCCQSA